MSSKEEQEESPSFSKSLGRVAPSGSHRPVIGTCTVQHLSRQKRLSSTYQGVRHLVPGNLSKLRELMKRGNRRKQIDALRVTGNGFSGNGFSGKGV